MQSDNYVGTRGGDVYTPVRKVQKEPALWTLCLTPSLQDCVEMDLWCLRPCL